MMTFAKLFSFVSLFLALYCTQSVFAQAELFKGDSSNISVSGGITLSSLHTQSAFGIGAGILGRISVGVGYSGSGRDAITSGYLEGLVLKSRGRVRFAIGPFIDAGSVSEGGNYFSFGGSIYLIGSINRLVSLEFGASGGGTGGSSGEQGGYIGLFSEGVNIRMSRRVLFTLGFTQSSISDIQTQYALVSSVAIVLGHH
jgi:hypothetical protein